MKHDSNSSKTINEFKYKQFEAEVILWVVRWYGQFAITIWNYTISQAAYMAVNRL